MVVAVLGKVGMDGRTMAQNRFLAGQKYRHRIENYTFR